MSIQCKSCGNFLDDNVKFCRYCGTAVETNQQIQQQVTQGYDNNAYNQQVQQQATQGYDNSTYNQQVQQQATQGYDNNQSAQGGTFQQNIYIDPILTQPPTFRESKFDGSVFETFCVSLGASLLTAITFGIAFPWALCIIWNFIVSHVVIDGKRLSFDGHGGQLLGNWIKWFILTIITFGIYGFWVMPRLCNWVAKHTHFRT